MERRTFLLTSFIPVLQAGLAVASPIDPNQTYVLPRAAPSNLIHGPDCRKRGDGLATHSLNTRQVKTDTSELRQIEICVYGTTQSAVQGRRTVKSLAILTIAGRRSDRIIATAVVACLRREVPRVSRSVVPIIRMGEVSLVGYVESDSQRWQAQKAVRTVRGVRNVIDLMVLRPVASHRALKHIAEKNSH
jgi:BON domain